VSWRRAFLVTSLASAALLAAIAATLCLTSGCTSLSYYAQAVGGHMDVMTRAKPVATLLEDATTPAALRDRLVLTQQMRDFASSELALPHNRSYRAYADLQRGAVVWNVVAAPELALTLKTWCFPVMGCVGYRGYFDRAGADALAEALRREGLEVNVYGVPAYSTLGWTNWLGGDPLLNTFIHWPEGELARLIFHELAHQVAYASDDTTFNESFATAVERIGGQRWLDKRASEAAKREYADFDARRRDFRALALRQRQRLQQLYASDMPDAEKRQRKLAVKAELEADIAVLKAGPWRGFTGYDAWFARANNASYAVQAAYDDLVPAFMRLYEQQGRDLPRFYAEVQRLSALPRAERRATLGAPP
jgi:predicted aminopeptidase